MRNKTTISLGPGRDIVVMEARVQDVRALLSWLPEDLDGRALLAELQARLPEILTVLGDCSRYPPGETLDSLSVSECATVIAAWWGLHERFFFAALAAMGLELAAEPQTKTSSAPASS